MGLKNLVKPKTMSDKMIGLDLMMAAAASAQGLCASATLANHPDLRRLFKEYLQEVFVEHEAIATYAADRDWIKPFESPEGRLREALAEVDEMIAVKA